MIGLVKAKYNLILKNIYLEVSRCAKENIGIKFESEQYNSTSKNKFLGLQLDDIVNLTSHCEPIISIVNSQGYSV